jgi:hypothetical protein
VWIGFLAACAGTVAGLANMDFVRLPPDWKRRSAKTGVQFGLAATAFLMGPFYSWTSFTERWTSLGIAVSTTFFFWLALLVAGAAAGAAGWKLVAEETKRAGGAAS